VVIEANKGLMY